MIVRYEINWKLGLVSDYGNTVIPRKIQCNSSARCTVFFCFWADILNLGLSFTECPRRRSQAMFDHHVHQGKFGAFPHSQITAIYSWLVVWNMNFKTFHILGMSSSQLTNSIIFQRGRYTTSQVNIPAPWGRARTRNPTCPTCWEA